MTTTTPKPDINAWLVLDKDGRPGSTAHKSLEEANGQRVAWNRDYPYLAPHEVVKMADASATYERDALLARNAELVAALKEYSDAGRALLGYLSFRTMLQPCPETDRLAKAGPMADAALAAAEGKEADRA